MLIEQALMTYLKAQSGITDLVSTRIYYVENPDQATSKPYIVFQKIDGPRGHSQDGSEGLAHPRFQFSMFAVIYASCKEIAAALQAALQGYKGTMGGVGGVDVRGVFYEDETDLEKSGQGLYGVACDYIIWHAE